jgi:rod shape-determining protein MreD
MNPYLTFPLLTGIALIQTTLLARVSVFGARPDLMLLVVLAWTVLRGSDEGLGWAFIGGLILDIISGGPLASTALALVAVAVMSGQSLGQGIGSEVVRLILLALLGALIYHLVLLILLNWTGHTIDWQFALAEVALPSALLNAALMPFVQQPLAWIERKTSEEGLTL